MLNKVLPGVKLNYTKQLVEMLSSHLPLNRRYSLLLIGLATLGLSVGLRQLGWLQTLELIAYDNLVQLQPQTAPDPRLLIVGITEDDIKNLEQWPISDQVVAQTLANLQTHNPKAIGLDIYRDIPQGGGRQQLLDELEADNLIAIKTIEGASAPEGVSPRRVGFNDVVLDSDGIVRRNLMAVTLNGTTIYSFALKLSLAYLNSTTDQITFAGNELKLGETTFGRLSPNSGSYQRVDSAGHQIMLRYRSAAPIARQLSLTEVLNNNFQPEWIEGKVVLIGATADSAKDGFLTPFTRINATDALTPGVEVHAHMVSQILGTVLEGQQVIWFLPNWAEILWASTWVMAGIWIGWQVKHPTRLVAGNIIALGVLGLISYGVFLQAGWIPIVEPLTAVIVSQGLVISYKRLYESTHDAITGLINREQLLDRLTTIFALSENRQIRFAILYLSINRFTIINESFGFDVGDEVLRTVSQRIQRCLSEHEILAKIGTNEFAIFVGKVKAAKDIKTLANKLNQKIGLPLSLHGKTIFLTSSMGIALSQTGKVHRPEDMLRDAHTAMYRARAAGKWHYEVFAISMHQEKLVRMQLESDLHAALERQEFLLHYQPIICLKTGAIAGFEALARWQHPEKGFISPGEFIPVAEETGIIVPLGRWIMETACAQMADWQRQFPSEHSLIISINLSPGQFSQPNLIEQIDAILTKTSVDRNSVKFEITETMVMENVQGAIETLIQLKKLDIKLGIDDFGTGYSSLNYLSRFPVDTLKVDRSFVDSMQHASNDFEVVRTIINLGHNLGMNIIAEGVEVAEQLAMLGQLDCEYAQGFYMSKPVSAALAEDLLKVQPVWAIHS